MIPSCSSKPAVEKVEGRLPMPDPHLLRQSPWLDVMDRVIAAEVAVAGSARGAGQLHLRGVIDVLAAYLGEERLCTAVYDDPEGLRQLAEGFADLYIETAGRGLQTRPPWRGGYVSTWGLYAPGPLVDYQIDASSLLSLETYREHFSPFDARVLSAFAHTVIHLHSCGLHAVPAVLDTDGVQAVQISLDREAAGYRQEPVLEACEQIQSRNKSLLVCGELEEDELDEFQRRLRPEGLAIFYWKPLGAG